ncbi:MAG: (2Fe-2S)-binding protein [Planctomycetes bacterium]|nr:(2Fe-2S)-binding protein [Planctomycetota bacterium]
MSGRIAGLDDATRGPRELIEFTFAGEKVTAWAGDSIAMALWAGGTTAVRSSSKNGSPRGVLCNMGICYECLVVVDGRTVRSCTTPVRAGMVVEPGGRP